MQSGNAFGDAEDMSGFAHGGHNSVTVISALEGSAYGDALTMSGFATGGFNTVTGATTESRVQTLYGDAGSMSGFASGGHNTLIGTTDTSFVMYGDAATLSDFASGGGNTLTGASASGANAPPVSNLMYGDGHDLLTFASGGGNTLVSGQGADDTMWGDAAVVSPFATTLANKFVFAPGNAHDTIMDFRSGMDHIDLRSFGFTDFAELEKFFQGSPFGLDIVFDDNNDILLYGVTQVAEGDFLLA